MQDLSSSNKNKLKKLRIKTLQRALIHGLIRWLIPLLSGALLMIWAQSREIAPASWTYLLTLTAYLTGMVVLTLHLLWRPVKNLLSNRKFVLYLAGIMGLGDVLVVMEEAVRLPENWKSTDPVNIAMRHKLHNEAAAVLARQTTEKVLPLSWMWQGPLVLLAVVAVGFLWSNQNVSGFQLGWQRLLNPWPAAEIVATQGIYTPNAPVQVVAGETVTLKGVDLASGSHATWCEIRRGQGLWQRFGARQEDVVFETFVPVAPYRLWVCDQARVFEDFEYRFGRDDIVSRVGRVEVRHHPLVAVLSGAIVPPAYTGLPRQALDRVPTWLDLPEGSRLELAGTLNHAVRQAEVIFDNSDSVSFGVSGHTIQASFNISRSITFHLGLVDSFGLANEAPLVYEVVATEDQIPTVALLRPADDGAVPLSGLLDLTMEAGDDYGIDKAELLVRTYSQGSSREVGEAGFFALPFWPAASAGDGFIETPFGEIKLNTKLSDTTTGNRLAMELQIDVGNFDLVAGDELELKVRVKDNRRPLPRGQGFSEVLKFMVPSVADALANQAETQEEHRASLEEVRKRGNQLGKDLDRLTRELMKNPIPDWARQKEMEAAIERQQELQEELARVAKELQQELDALAQSQLTSERMMEKAEQVSQLLSSEASDQLKDLLKKMEEASGQVSPKEVAKAMEEVAQQQKEMARRMDAALAMLKKMEQEQKLEGMVALLEKMIAKQQELADLSREMAEDEDKPNTDPGQVPDEGQDEQSDAEKQDQANELARRQDALQEEMKQLQEKMQEAMDEMAEQKAEGREQDPSQEKMAEALEQAMQQMKKQQDEESMSKAAEMLEKMDPEMAAKMQQQALRDLGSLYHVLLETQSAMQMAMEQQQVASLRRLASDLLSLSQRQEEISQSIPLQLREVRSKNITRGEHRLQKSTIQVRSELAELAAEAPMRIMKLLKSMDSVIETMGRSLRNLEDSRGSAARREASASLAELNGIVISLLTEAQITGNGSGSGSSCQSKPSPGEQLKEMLMEQAKLNGMTEQLRQMLANRGISQQARAQMKRLGDKQGELAGRIEEMAEDQAANPDGDRLLGDMERLGQDMESVGQDLGDGLVSEETLVRQERILSRMLAARNAARRRDYSSKRESQTAGRIFGHQDGRSSDKLGSDEDNPFSRRYVPLEKAPAEFRELVRRYFRALEKMGRKEEVVP